MFHTRYYDQTEARARLKKMNNQALSSIAVRLENRLAGIEKLVDWPALQQSLARDIKAVHDELDLRSKLSATDKIKESK